MKIGIVDLSSEGWSAGRTYAQGLASSLNAAGAEAALLSDQPGAPGDLHPTLRLPAEHYRPGEWTLRKILGRGRKNRLDAAVHEYGLGVIGPLTHPAMLTRGARNVAWIPDFQPFYLSHLYEKDELSKIKSRTAKLLAGCDNVILSSQDSLRALSELYPAFQAKARVLSFPSLFAFHCPEPEEESAAATFGLPDRFLLVANQFWKHKNHIVVPKALGLLRRRGLDIPCAMIGLPADFRDRSNGVLSALLQEIARQGVWDLCRLLGLVSRSQLLSLLRSAAALVQPSLFEGWNTTVQDAQALGCPIIASDLPVHREQTEGSFFDPEDAASLADVLAQQWAQLPIRPDSARETAALAREKTFAAEHGRLARTLFSAGSSTIKLS